VRTGRRSGRAGALPPNSTDALLEVAELTGHGPEPAHLPERLWIEPRHVVARMPDRTADFAAEILKNGADLKTEISRARNYLYLYNLGWLFLATGLYSFAAR
jgi:hypothetical protein